MYFGIKGKVNPRFVVGSSLTAQQRTRRLCAQVTNRSRNSTRRAFQEHFIISFFQLVQHFGSPARQIVRQFGRWGAFAHLFLDL